MFWFLYQFCSAMDIIHLLTGCEWNSSFIQAEARTLPRGLGRGEEFMSRVEFRDIPLKTFIILMSIL